MPEELSLKVSGQSSNVDAGCKAEAHIKRFPIGIQYNTGHTPHVAWHPSIYGGVRVLGNYRAIHINNAVIGCALAVDVPCPE